MRWKGLSIFYLLTTGGVLGIILFVISQGEKLRPTLTPIASAADSEKQIAHGWSQAFSNPLAILILQMVIIIVISRAFAVALKQLGQPSVVGEIVAGIVLGPSLMGQLLPGVSAFIFPPASMGNLQMLSQVGLILFMFVVGMELNLETLKKKAGPAVVISHASIVIPYALGVILAYFLYTSYAPVNIPFYAFALFLGIAMSITAFPVLARIIKERQMVNTRLGTIAITCAAADDITAWCLLAFVIGLVKAGSLAGSIYTLLMTVAYILVMLLIVKPLLSRFIMRRNKNGGITGASVALIFTTLLVSALISEAIGIHALFGAFLAGIIMPQTIDFREHVIGKTEDVATVLLLPLFFIFTGLRTQINLLNEGGLLATSAIIVLVAVVGKLGGSALAARVSGESTYNSLAIGALVGSPGTELEFAL